MNEMQTTMRIPCSRCGQLNNVERAAEVTFRCTACGSPNTVRTLASNGATPVEEPRRAPRRWQPALTARSAGPRVAAAGPAERRSSFGRAKQVLVALMVLATAGVLIHPSGTFATFNAQTTNAATITSGVLLLGNKVATGTECFSAGQGTPNQTIGSTNTSNCTSVWNATITPGATNTTGTSFEVAVRNVGNITPSTFELYASSPNTCDSAPGYTDATSGTTFKGSNQAGLTSTLNGATAIGATSFTVASSANFTPGEVIQIDSGAQLESLTLTTSAIVGNTLVTTTAATKTHANGVTVAGEGLCRAAQLVIAKTTNSGFNVLAPSGCVYGNTSSGTVPFTGCAYDSTHDLRDFNDNDTSGTPISLGAFAPGTTDYFVVDVLFPTASDNGYQGLGANVTFTWFAQQ
jgi:hypothetical protein